MSERNVEDGGRVPRCLPVVQKGIRTAADCTNLMSALMADLADGRVTPQVGNAINSAMGKLLKGLRNDDDYADLTRRLRSVLGVPDVE